MTLLSLPNEVLSSIVNELDSLKDIHAVASTSHYLEKVCNSGCISSRRLYELYKPTVPYIHRHMLLAAVKARQLADATQGSRIRKLWLNDAVLLGIKGLCDLALEIAPLIYQDLRAVLVFQEGSLAWGETFVNEHGNKEAIDATNFLTSSIGIRKSLVHLEIYMQLFHDTFDAQAEDISSPTPVHRSFGEMAALDTRQIRVEYFEHCVPEGDFSNMLGHANFQLVAIMITLPVFGEAVEAALADSSKVGPLDIPGTSNTILGIRGRLEDSILHRGLGSIRRCVEGTDLDAIQSFVTAMIKALRCPEHKWRSIMYDIRKVKRRDHQRCLLDDDYGESEDEDEEEVFDHAIWDDSAAEDDTDVESPDFLYRGGFCPTPEEDPGSYRNRSEEENR